jgi:molybdate transport system ATP-binding protein
MSDIIAARFAGKLGAFSLDVAFDAPTRGVTALFGPSGCGKTTILRCMAGLQRLPGRLSVGGAVWQDDAVFRQPHQRPAGYVFQDASLFAHLSVRDNLRYGQRRAAGAAEVIGFDAACDLLGIGHLLDRAPARLSGGERQRVAVGRALLSRPSLLLMDEPLSALDQAVKDDILPYFETLRDRLAIPIVYVSHDLAEVERLADRVVLLDRGRVVATGALADLETDPRLPLARMARAAVVLDGEVAAVDTAFGLTTLTVAGGALVAPGRHGGIGAKHRVRIGAADVSFVLVPSQDTTILNCLPARIVSIDPHDADGIQLNVVAVLGHGDGGARIVARITRKSREALGLEPGRAVYAQIKGVALVAPRG